MNNLFFKTEGKSIVVKYPWKIMLVVMALLSLLKLTKVISIGWLTSILITVGIGVLIFVLCVCMVIFGALLFKNINKRK